MIKEMPDLKVIGITGSYGKTSVKYFLNKLLSAKYNVLMTFCLDFISEKFTLKKVFQLKKVQRTLHLFLGFISKNQLFNDFSNNA